MTEPIDGFFNDQPEGLHVAQLRTTGYYALQLPEAGFDAETQTLVVLHGWGQNARSFIRKFAPMRQHNVFIIAPQAPHQFYLDMETRKVGFGWMTAFDRDRAISDVVAGIDSILDGVEEKYGEATRRPCVLGFSQGVSIAWRYLIHGKRNVAGLVASGGDLPPDVDHRLPSHGPLSILLAHGREDTIVPWAKAQSAESRLRELHFPLETNYFAGGHDFPADLMERLPGWFDEVNPRKGA